MKRHWMLNPIGEQLAAARRKCGMKQRQLAQHLHVAQGTVSAWELGTQFPRKQYVPALATCLHLDEKTLLYALGDSEIMQLRGRWRKNPKMFLHFALQGLLPYFQMILESGSSNITEDDFLYLLDTEEKPGIPLTAGLAKELLAARQAEKEEKGNAESEFG